MDHLTDPWLEDLVDQVKQDHPSLHPNPTEIVQDLQHCLQLLVIQIKGYKIILLTLTDQGSKC